MNTIADKLARTVTGTPRIACVGEAMLELTVRDIAGSSGNTRLSFAGDTLNTAIYLKRALGDRAEVAYISRVGTDTFSDQLLQFIAGEDISIESIQRCSDKVPGLYAITTDAQGERSFTYWRENSAARELFRTNAGPDCSVLDSFQVVYLSGISLAILPPETRDALLAWLARKRKTAGLIVAFDANYRPRLWHTADEARHYLDRAWKIADIALPSLDDEQQIHGTLSPSAIINRIRNQSTICGVLKCGADGPVCFNHSSEETDLSLGSVKVVDTSAAGDSFNGAYIAGLVAGKTERQSLIDGHRRAADVITYTGAIIPRHPE